ncbi:hypothetical protein [Streptomyces sp. HPF1205]|uniref:hypothetical protein n=1 Tax=Streptomyces sp. HPF1205 TaxID=2873262 RepID=UPI001CECE3D8|nr:hypothetical protein [Streptomyces sp. HPF1205]
MATMRFGSTGDSVLMRNAVFRLMLARAVPMLDNPADKDELEMDAAIGGISFDLLEPGQRHRLARAVHAGFLQLKADVTAGVPLEEPVLPGIQEKLDELIEFMARHLESTEPPSH